MNLVNFRSVIASLAIQLPNYVWDEIFIANCCLSCQRDMIGYGELIQFKHFQGQVKNKRVEKPCDFYRSISIKINGNLINYTHVDKNTIYVGNYDDGCIVDIHYKAIPMDDEGFPLIIEEHTMAHVAFIIKTMLYPKMLSNKVPQFIYNNARLEAETLIAYCRGIRNLDENEMSKVLSVMNSVYPYLIEN